MTGIDSKVEEKMADTDSKDMGASIQNDQVTESADILSEAEQKKLVRKIDLQSVPPVPLR